MANPDDDIVTFLNSAGEEISNDPRWLAKRNLAQTGTDVDAIQAENEALRARIAELESSSPQGVDEDEDQNEDGDDYDKLDGKALKALAAEREVDIKGLTKVSEVRNALREADKA